MPNHAAGPRPNKRATISDVAREAGVSVATVSNVLNGRFGSMLPETRGRVETVIERLSYRPSSLARGLRTKRTAVVGLIVPSASNGVYPAIIKGAQDTALQHGYDIFVCSTDRDPARNDIHVASLLGREVDGIVFVHSLLPTDPLVASVAASGTRVVAFAPSVEPWPVDTLCLDNARATAVLIQYLHRLGHHRIAYANHSLTTNAASRIGTWRATLRGLGVAVPDGYLMTERVAPGSDEGYEIDAGRTLAKRLLGLPDPPTAIVGGNDLIAAGIIVGAKEIGFRVPADVSVVGYDDLAVGRVTDPTLTTMVFPKAEMGRRAFDLLINRSPRDGGAPVRQLVFEFDLLVRESSETAHS